VPAKPPAKEELDRKTSFINRELSWLGFARRVLALVAREDLPLLERVKFVGIVGMLHDEFFMKRISGLKREIARGVKKISIDGRRPSEEFAACRKELLRQRAELDDLLEERILPALVRGGLPIVPYAELDEQQQSHLRDYFQRNVQPILTPLAVDSEHPFPFISNLGLNLAVLFRNGDQSGERFVRIKVPGNRPRWIPLLERPGVVRLEQVIAANLDLLYPGSPPRAVHLFQVTRGADPDDSADLSDVPLGEPGSIIQQVSSELKARRFAGPVRLQVEASAPKKFTRWLIKQLGLSADDVYPTKSIVGLSDLQSLESSERDDLRLPRHEPVIHPRLIDLPADDPRAMFDEIARGDILLHHPYHSFDSSVLRFLDSAATDPAVLALKLSIYRTGSDSPIVNALVEAARRGKQVAVLVEITARFDEAPNIAWGRFLEKEGVHVSYGVERLKTHVKLGLLVREEGDGIRRYAHIGTGNYHTGTARIYEDLGVLTCDPEICEDVAAVFNSLTGAIPYPDRGKLIVAPKGMRRRFTELIRREAEHARAGRPAGIDAKMNQLQDSGIIRELYVASRAGVPINLNVRGLCCLRPGVPGLSETIRVFGAVGRFLEHSRIFRFSNGGQSEHYIGSADWMKRNLNNRVETVAPVTDPTLKSELDEILAVYEDDNCSVWDCGPDGAYVRREPAEGEPPREAQETFVRLARRQAGLEPLETPIDERTSVNDRTTAAS
jgi:polyphosphate kinase